MQIPHEVCVVFLFVLGGCVGSFLNVVVYRLPLDMSLSRPGSHCPACEHAIAWYDNIPIFAWLLLGGRCRHCKAAFSIRYPLVELFTAFMFVGLYWVYFDVGVLEAMPEFAQGGWMVYAGHIILLSVLLVSSLIDAEHWIIPLSVSYTAAAAGLILSMFWPYWVGLEAEQLWKVVPYAGVKSGAAAIGGVIGLVIGLLMIKFGLIKRSFFELEEALAEKEPVENKKTADTDGPDIEVNIRLEMGREMAFLAPAVVLGVVFVVVSAGDSVVAGWWSEIISTQKWFAGLLGSVFGFMIGGAVVWATRILGSLAFGREAMGLGDVHLMAAVGAVLGWFDPTIAFFVAPFFGLGWAIVRLVSHRSREIPYGPFLSMATVVVMIFHDPIVAYFLRLGF